MDKRVYRYLGITALVVLAFFLFTNITTEDYPYRAEMKTLPKEAAYCTSLFAEVYRDFESKGVYDIEALEKQIAIFDSLVDRYRTLEKLPEEALEDHEKLMTTLVIQQLTMRDIYLTALTGVQIPGEQALALREVVEARVLYEGRVGRY